MAGKWDKTRMPSVYVQTDKRTNKPRYKASFRDSRGAITSKTFPRLSEAKSFLSDLHTRKGKGELPDTRLGRKTVSELWKHFKATSRARESTLAWYEARWDKWVAPEFDVKKNKLDGKPWVKGDKDPYTYDGGRRVDSIKRSEVEAFYADVEKKSSLATRRAVQQLTHKLFAVAVRSEWLTKNPADGIEMPTATVESEPRALTDEEIVKLAGETPDRYRALVWTLAETGARIGELSALRVKNLDGSIRIVENSPEVGGRKISGAPKTKASQRVVPISPKLRSVLKDHYDAGYANRFDPTSYVFTTESGGQIRQGNFRKRVLQPAAERAGIGHFTTHWFRHTAISLWLMRGLSPWEVSKMVGHTDLKLIEARYGHIYEKELQKKIDGLSQAGVS